MMCPKCKIGVLEGDASDYRRCTQCGLLRRPDDRVVQRKSTNFFVLNRNIKRTPAGAKVELLEQRGDLSGIHGTFKFSNGSFHLRAVATGLIIGSSRDRDDLAVLVAEHDWQADGPDDFVSSIEGLKE